MEISPIKKRDYSPQELYDKIVFFLKKCGTRGSDFEGIIAVLSEEEFDLTPNPHRLEPRFIIDHLLEEKRIGYKMGIYIMPAYL